MYMKKEVLRPYKDSNIACFVCPSFLFPLNMNGGENELISFIPESKKKIIKRQFYLIWSPWIFVSSSFGCWSAWGQLFWSSLGVLEASCIVSLYAL